MSAGKGDRPRINPQAWYSSAYWDEKQPDKREDRRCDVCNGVVDVEAALSAGCDVEAICAACRKNNQTDEE